MKFFCTRNGYKFDRGVTVMLVLVFMGVFGLIISSVASYIFAQAQVGRAKYAQEQAFQIAEAGLEYYQWFLAHNPNDLTNGTGEEGPYSYTVNDPEGGELGEARISVSGNTACGVVQSVDIVSEGVSNASPRYTRTVATRYARPSVAEYSYILNSNVWAGDDRVISGPYHSNGGIRMDGINNAAVSSSVEQWVCTSSFGCSFNQVEDGVFGDGTDASLWEYPVPQIDFAGISVDLAAMKDYARDNGGLYFGPLGGRSDRRGYHAVFKEDGSVDVYRVRDIEWVWGYTIEDGWDRDYIIIDDKTFLGNYDVPEDCPVVYFEDKLWVEGVVNGRMTVAAADTSQPNHDPDIILNGNITYASASGVDGLTLVAENDVLIGLTTPNNMELHGIFIAQKGRYGRNHYTTSGSTDVPSQYNSYVMQDSLLTVGTVVSNLRTGTQWSCSGTPCSGYLDRTDSYDRFLAQNPPPFTPVASQDAEFILWREE